MNLCQQRPVEIDEGEIVDYGTFFNLFTTASDPFQVSRKRLLQ